MNDDSEVQWLCDQAQWRVEKIDYIRPGSISDFLGLPVLAMDVDEVDEFCITAVILSTHDYCKVSRTLEANRTATILVCEEQSWDWYDFYTLRAASCVCCDGYHLVSSLFAFILRGALRQSLTIAVIEEWWNYILLFFH